MVCIKWLKARGPEYYYAYLSGVWTSNILTEPAAKPAAKCPDRT